jgi:hypothetical protein
MAGRARAHKLASRVWRRLYEVEQIAVDHQLDWCRHLPPLVEERDEMLFDLGVEIVQHADAHVEIADHEYHLMAHGDDMVPARPWFWQGRSRPVNRLAELRDLAKDCAFAALMATFSRLGMNEFAVREKGRRIAERVESIPRGQIAPVSTGLR